MNSIDGSGIDQILREAVDSGGVPHVAAIAADRDGVIYQGGFDGDTPVLRPPASQATVRQLLTHTSGLGYWFWSDDLVRWESLTGIPNVVAGTTLDVAVKEGVTGPLGMDQTTFLMDDDQRAGATPVHIRADGQWTAIGEVLNQAPEYYPNSSGPLTLGPGFKWGYGLLLNTEDQPGGRRAGSGAWAGLCNTHFWIDPATGVTASVYSNFLPFITPEGLQLYNDFERALYMAL